MFKEKPHYLNHRDRLRQHYLQGGNGVLRDYEIVELLLFYAIPRREVKGIAKQLLARFGSLRGIIDADINELQSITGISQCSATLIKLIKDIIPLYLQEQVEEKPQINCSKEFLDYWRSRLGTLPEEQFCVIYLNSANMVLGAETISEGTVNSVLVQPRRVIEKALKKGAAAIILVHNHPSGVATPSANDVDITKKIIRIGAALDIKMHDHVIICREQYFSFHEAGILGARDGVFV